MWQAIVLTLQIMLLAVSWTLFQQARTELNAKAAETPVLGEIRSLQQRVQQMLQELQTTADNSVEKIQHEREEAEQILNELHSLLLQNSAAEQMIMPPLNLLQQEEYICTRSEARPLQTEADKKLQIYRLADEGLDTASIARSTGISEGEAETILGLRVQ